MALAAILFDFDFTLADSSAPVVACITHALKSMGYSVPGREAIERTIGLALPETFARLAPGGDPEELRRLFHARADEVMVTGTRLFPETIEVAMGLKRLGLKLGIVSTKLRFRIEAILAAHGAADCFDLVVGGEDVGKPKPAPDGLWQGCHRLDVTPDEVLYVGDSLVDAEAAAQAGLRFVAVLHGRTAAGEFAGYKPLAILPDLEPLLELVKAHRAA